MNLDVVVFVFGLSISTLVAAGLLLVFYGYAYLEEARREHRPEPADAARRTASLW